MNPGGLPNHTATLQITVASYATPGSYMIELRDVLALDLGYVEANIIIMEPLLVQIGSLTPPPTTSDFDWEAEAVTNCSYESRTAMTFLADGTPAIAFSQGDWYSGFSFSCAWKDTAAWQITTVDSIRVTDCSMKTLPNGQPAVSYYDYNNHDLKYAWYDGVNWNTETVDSPGSVGSHNSLAILPSGQPAISYYDDTNDDLKYAEYDGTTWQIQILDSIGNVGRDTSLAILPNGQPAISYYDGTNRDLKYAWRDGTGWQTTTVDSSGTVGLLTSLTILPSGHPAICYRDTSDHTINYAAFDGANWSIEPIYSQSNGNPYAISLAIMPDGNPGVALNIAIADDDYNLYYVTWDGLSWTLTDVDMMGQTGYNAVMAVGPDGEPGIAFKKAPPYAVNFVRHISRENSPVTMSLDYISHAESDYGPHLSVHNGTAQVTGSGYASTPPTSTAISQAIVQPTGHLRTEVILQGVEGTDWMMECMEWDPETGECMAWEEMPMPVSADGAAGNVAGTLTIGTSANYPEGTPLELTGQLIVRGSPGISCIATSLQLTRDTTPLIDYSGGLSNPPAQTVTVYAGETLNFSIVGDIDYSCSSGGYETHVDGRWTLAAPAVVPPTITNAVSRRLHNGQPFDMPIWNVALPVECRNGGPQQLIVTFDQPIEQVTSTNADVTLSSGTLNPTNGIVINGNELTLNLSGAANDADLTVDLSGIATAGHLTLTVEDLLSFNVLTGDLNGDGAVNLIDMAQSKTMNRASLEADLGRFDVNVDGLLDLIDTALVRSCIPPSGP